MGRGVSCGGGQSSLGYLFGGGETDGNAQPPPPPENPTGGPTTEEPSKNPPEPSNDNDTNTVTDEPSRKPPSEGVNIFNRNPNDDVHNGTTNNYHRADGQNCGNFLTGRPSTKVHAAPGGSSSLGFLFGDDKK